MIQYLSCDHIILVTFWQLNLALTCPTVFYPLLQTIFFSRIKKKTFLFFTSSGIAQKASPTVIVACPCRMSAVVFMFEAVYVS